MATTKKEKKTVAGVKTTKASGTKGKKTSKAKEQIAELEKALENLDEKKVMELLPEEVKADILKNEDLSITANDTPIDFDAEVKKIFENPEPSEEVKEQIAEFEAGKEKFEEAIQKNPEKTEEVVSEELKRVEKLKAKMEAMQKNVRNRHMGNEGFTSWWNGSSDLF